VAQPAATLIASVAAIPAGDFFQRIASFFVVVAVAGREGADVELSSASLLNRNCR
jgi:hypothetical protein